MVPHNLRLNLPRKPRRNKASSAAFRLLHGLTHRRRAASLTSGVILQDIPEKIGLGQDADQLSFFRYE
jgi:hypothetical protein